MFFRNIKYFALSSILILVSCGSEVEQETPSNALPVNGNGNSSTLQTVSSVSAAIVSSLASNAASSSSAIIASSSSRSVVASSIGIQSSLNIAKSSSSTKSSFISSKSSSSSVQAGVSSAGLSSSASFSSSSSSKRTSSASVSSSVASSKSAAMSSSSMAVSSEASASSEALVSKPALQIIEDHCVSCHMGWHDKWSEYDESDWVTAVAGAKNEPLFDVSNPEDSLFVRKISFYSAAESNMPMQGSEQAASFTKDDYDILVDWVVNMVETEHGSASQVSSVAEVSSENSVSSAVSVSSGGVVVSSSVGEVSSISSESISNVSSSQTQAVSSLSESSGAQTLSSSSEAIAVRTAIEIINQECASCHLNFHIGWKDMSEADWLSEQGTSEPLINVLDPENSLLLKRMVHYGGENSNMPTQYAEPVISFDEEDYETIKAWLLDLVPDSGATSSIASSGSSVSSELSVSSDVASEGNSSLAVSSSVTSSAMTASSAPAVTQNAVEIIRDFCTSCHFGIHDSWDSLVTDEDWRRAQSTKGESYINSLDPENSLILRRIRNYGEKTSTMPPDNAAQSEPFTDAHYDVLVEWVRSFAAKPSTPIEGSNVTIESAELTELGFSATLSCEAGSDLTLALLDPERIGYGSVGDYDAIISRESSFETQDSSSVMVPADDGSFYLVGEGADLWGEAVYFNALRTEIIGGQLDMTLDVKEVSGVEHDFAKVGLLVSDSADLSGQMVFVHWSGRQGLAEDSGVGALNSYRLIEANPVDGAVTPAPARIRIAYQNDTLKVGACLGCDSPAIGAPKTLNFKPTHAFIVASSHEPDSVIQARMSLLDAYSVEGKYQEIYRQTMACADGNVSWVVPNSDSALDFDRLFVEAYIDDDLVASSSVVQTFTNTASCEDQDELLLPKLRRLSQEQIRNSIESVFGKIFANDIWPDLEDGARLIGMNNTADKLNINNLNYERLYDMVKDVSATLLEDSLNTCRNAATSDCVNDWMQAYGERLWRRPLTSIELESLNEGIAAFTTNEQRLAFSIHSLLLSSNFYFRSEIGTLTDGLNQLTNYEMVSLLSYALVNTTPDDELLELAAQIEPLLANQLRSQAERLLALPAVNPAMVSLYKDYLKLDLVLSRPKADSLGFNELVRADVLASAELSLADKIAENTDFTDVFLSSSFYVNSNIDYLFGTSSASSTLTKVDVNGSERQGLLNHPAFLAVHSTLATSGIVKRGVFTLEQLLCQELPDPPGNVMPQPIPEGIDASITSERELLQISHSGKAACIGCHQVIDPAGFGFENFDVIGRYRTEEKGSVMIDASGTLSNVGGTDLTFNNSAEYASVLATSPQMRACVSRRFLESFLGQNVSMESCEVKKYQRLVNEKGGSVQDLLYALIELESFSKRQSAH